MKDVLLVHEGRKFPLVSVLIPLYNHAKYIEECLDSILTQDFTCIEIIVVDDASTDHGLQLAKSKLASSSIKYKILENRINLGICATLNRAVQASEGEYVCIIASDDLLATGRIQRHVDILEGCSDTSVIACHGPLQVISEYRPFAGEKNRLSKEQHYDLYSVVTKTSCPSIQGCTFIASRLKKFPFDESLYFEDWDFFIRSFMSGYRVIYDDFYAVIYREHAGGANRNIDRMLESRHTIRMKHLEGIYRKDPSLAMIFNFTIDFSNLMGISYTGRLRNWSVAFARLLIKNPKLTFHRTREILWSFRNLISSKLSLS